MAFYRSLAGAPAPGANIVEACRRIYAHAFPGQDPGNREAVMWLRWLVNSTGPQIRTAGEVLRRNFAPLGILIDIFHNTPSGRGLLQSLDTPGVMAWSDTPYRPLPIDMAGEYAVDPVHYYDTTIKVLSWVRLRMAAGQLTIAYLDAVIGLMILPTDRQYTLPVWESPITTGPAAQDAQSAWAVFLRETGYIDIISVYNARVQAAMQRMYADLGQRQQVISTALTAARWLSGAAMVDKLDAAWRQWLKDRAEATAALARAEQFDAEYGLSAEEKASLAKAKADFTSDEAKAYALLFPLGLWREPGVLEGARGMRGLGAVQVAVVATIAVAAVGALYLIIQGLQNIVALVGSYRMNARTQEIAREDLARAEAGRDAAIAAAQQIEDPAARARAIMEINERFAAEARAIRDGAHAAAQQFGDDAGGILMGDALKWVALAAAGAAGLYFYLQKKK